MKLPNITLLGIDCVDVVRLQAAMDVCEKEIEFGAVKLLTSLATDDKRLVKIGHIGSIEEYSRFCLEDLVNYVDTDYVLLVQYDGFILNPKSWTDEFLKYDYIGAPWLVADWSVTDFNFPAELIGTRIVGNGGFSLRSKKFLQTTAKLIKAGKILKTHPEDVSVCVWNRDVIEGNDISFAPVELARRFSIEGEEEIFKDQFGFHGFAWTNIDDWIDRHPEQVLICKEYRRLRTGTVVDPEFTEKMKRISSDTIKNITAFFEDKAVEAHIFGSAAKGTNDALSDIDIWLTFNDSDIETVLNNRMEYYARFGEIIIYHEMQNNFPLNGIQTAIIYKIEDELVRVDFYLCPLFSSRVLPGSKILLEKVKVEEGNIIPETKRTPRDLSDRVTFFIMMCFNGIKKVVRKEEKFMEFLLGEFQKYDKDFPELMTVPRENSFEMIKKSLIILDKFSVQEQKRAVSEINSFLGKVAKMC